MISMLLKGIMVSGSLIVAIGGQNAFLLKQGLLKRHVFSVATICFLCDVVLLSCGVLGMGALIGGSPHLSALLTLLGALFLLAYGARSLRSAFGGQSAMAADDDKTSAGSLKQTVLATLAITLLNPHVYLDTVVLVGGIAAPLAADEKRWFLAGSLLVSLLWFYGVGYGARLLRPLFASRRAWQLLEVAVCALMWTLAFGLLRHLFAVWPQ